MLLVSCTFVCGVCFFKQKTAYDMRISDWSSDVCSSDLPTFFDLYGFFPGSFVGNPDLKAERGWNAEAGIGWTNGTIGIDVTAFTARLKDERSEERRVGKECVRTRRSRWSRYT